MSQGVEACPLCGSRRSRLFDRRTFLGTRVANRICRDCGLVYESPRMTDEQAAQFYKGEYRRLYQAGEEGPIAEEIAFQGRRAVSLLQMVAGRVSKVKRHLDVGCSTGALLSTFREQFGCEAVGIEPGQAFREHAAGQGLKVHPSLEALQQEAEPRFDLISMAHVLEHIPDPVAYLTHLRQEHLTPDGWLFIDVPNVLTHNSFEIAHVISFSRHTLRQVLERSGFEVVQAIEHGHPRTRLSPLYLNFLARPAPSGGSRVTVEPERFVRAKRTMGIALRIWWDVLYLIGKSLQKMLQAIGRRRH